jgi:lactoylglutathione lyase
MAGANVKQAVPFFWVSDIQKSLAFYIEGLGFQMTRQWTPEGKLRWCWLELGDAALMLQEFPPNHPKLAGAKLGQGVSICFMCQDALAIYRETTARGIAASEPQVGNGLWVTCMLDPDGYRVDFESPTDVPEETRLSELT